MRLLLGFGTHPGKAINITGESLFQRLHHLQSAVFALRPKSLRNIFFADSFPQVSGSKPHAALPPRRKLLSTGKLLAEKVEVLIHKRGRQERCTRVHNLPAEVGLPVIERGSL